MPRYIYACSSCNGCFQVWHGMKEVQESCQLCNDGGHLTKIPQIPIVKKEETKDGNVGDLTKNYIEENQKLLKEMKKEARNQTYDD